MVCPQFWLFYSTGSMERWQTNQWTSVASSVQSDFDWVPASVSFWNSRRAVTTEVFRYLCPGGSEMRLPILSRSQSVLCHVALWGTLCGKTGDFGRKVRDVNSWLRCDSRVLYRTAGVKSDDSHLLWDVAVLGCNWRLQSLCCSHTSHLKVSFALFSLCSCNITRFLLFPNCCSES